MIPLGQAARYLRQRLCLSQRAAAGELGISFVHLSNIENGNASPSPKVIEKYYEAWGIDLYMFAVGMFTDHARLPGPLRGPLHDLTEAWQQELESVVEARRKEVDSPCSGSSA
jgi:transcriptional regulator with XRE-family HTH domain